MKTIYAMYRGDNFIDLGTLDELATNVYEMPED